MPRSTAAALAMVFKVNENLITRSLDGLGLFLSVGRSQSCSSLTGPIPAVKTLGDQIAFFALHESYHVGQMGYIRKALGFPGLVG